MGCDNYVHTCSRVLCLPLPSLHALDFYEIFLLLVIIVCRGACMIVVDCPLLETPVILLFLGQLVYNGVQFSSVSLLPLYILIYLIRRAQSLTPRHEWLTFDESDSPCKCAIVKEHLALRNSFRRVASQGQCELLVWMRWCVPGDGHYLPNN